MCSHETPLQRAPALSARFRNEIYLKREDMQPVFSFKLRGAYVDAAELTTPYFRLLARGVD